MSVHDNVATRLAGSPSGNHPEDVAREEVIAARRVALMHEFVRDLPDGYDTILGNSGAIYPVVKKNDWRSSVLSRVIQLP